MWTAEIGFWNGNDNCSIYNACRKFGSCNVNNSVLCKCLPAFQPTNPGKWNSGDFLDGCTKNLTSSDNSDMFLNLTIIKVNNPDSRIYDANNETECRKQCLNSSLCQASSYEVAQNSNIRGDTTTRTNNCWIWISDLINLQEEYSNGGVNLSVRVAKSVRGTPFTH
jgi:hypothetical protein